jgi:hypothetical protein
MDTITLTTASTVYNLYALLSAADTTLPKPAQALMIQADIDAGAARCFIGDKKMLTNLASYGTCLEAAWSMGIDSLGANLLVLPDIYLYTDTNGSKLHVTVITR